MRYGDLQEAAIRGGDIMPQVDQIKGFYGSPAQITDSFTGADWNPHSGVEIGGLDNNCDAHILGAVW